MVDGKDTANVNKRKKVTKLANPDYSQSTHSSKIVRKTTLVKVKRPNLTKVADQKLMALLNETQKFGFLSGDSKLQIDLLSDSHPFSQQ